MDDVYIGKINGLLGRWSLTTIFFGMSGKDDIQKKCYTNKFMNEILQELSEFHPFPNFTISDVYKFTNELPKDIYLIVYSDPNSVTCYKCKNQASDIVKSSSILRIDIVQDPKEMMYGTNVSIDRYISASINLGFPIDRRVTLRYDIDYMKELIKTDPITKIVLIFHQVPLWMIIDKIIDTIDTFKNIPIYIFTVDNNGERISSIEYEDGKLKISPINLKKG